jgi:hypothetical protein
MRKRNRKRISMNRYRTVEEGIVRIPGGTGKEEEDQEEQLQDQEEQEGLEKKGKKELIREG